MTDDRPARPVLEAVMVAVATTLVGGLAEWALDEWRARRRKKAKKPQKKKVER